MPASASPTRVGDAKAIRPPRSPGAVAGCDFQPGSVAPRRSDPCTRGQGPWVQRCARRRHESRPRSTPRALLRVLLGGSAAFGTHGVRAGARHPGRERDGHAEACVAELARDEQMVPRRRDRPRGAPRVRAARLSDRHRALGPGSLMCAYNKINGAYACGNDSLLNGAIKNAIGFKGFVMSDWKAVYSWDFALKGPDQHSGVQLDRQEWFVAPLREAYAQGKFPKERLSDMVRRILRAIYTTGIDTWSGPGPVADMEAHHQAVLEVA